MASGSIYLGSSKAWEGNITWSSTPNTAGNYSDVYVCATMWKTDGYTTSSNSPTSGTITINGAQYDLIEHNEFEDEVCIYEGTVRVYHNGDGTKAIAISLTCNGQPGTSLSGYTLSGSGTAVLDSIPRTSTLSADSGILGTAQVLTITAASSSLTHSIDYACGDLSGNIATKTTATSIEWTPPLALAEANPNGASVTAKLTLTTYSGSTAIGTHCISVYYTIGSGVAPTFTVDFSDATGYKDIYGYFIQLRSKLKIKVNPTTMYGATVKTCRINVNGETFTDLEAVASEIDLYGSINVYVVIQDSRGKVAQGNFYVQFHEYSPPYVSSLTVKRCNSNGTSNDQGGYVQVTYSAKATSLDNQNTVAYKLEYKKSTDSAFTVVNLPQFANEFYVNSETYIFAADTGSSYNVQLTVTDAFGAVVKTTLASTAATIMHFKADGKGIGLGKVSEVADAVDIGWKINMNNLPIKNVPAPEEDGDGANKGYVDSIIEKAYPVGAIYISTVSTSPASLFGGTWEQITERFLYAANDDTEDYTGGKTGGEATHTLTIEEMPSHTHEMYSPPVNTRMAEGSSDYWPITYSSSDGNGALVKAAGGSAAHNNMPPYLTVYMWKRVE